MRVIAEQQNEKKSYSNLTILNKNSKLRLSHRKFSYLFCNGSLSGSFSNSSSAGKWGDKREMGGGDAEEFYSTH